MCSEEAFMPVFHVLQLDKQPLGSTTPWQQHSRHTPARSPPLLPGAHQQAAGIIGRISVGLRSSPAMWRSSYCAIHGHNSWQPPPPSSLPPTHPPTPPSLPPLFLACHPATSWYVFFFLVTHLIGYHRELKSIRFLPSLLAN